MHILKVSDGQRQVCLKAILLTWLAATVVTLCVLSDAGRTYSQVVRPGEQSRPPDVPTSRLEIPADGVAACGYSPSLLYQLNRQANPTARLPLTAGVPPPAITSVFTQQGNFPPAQVVTCGKFRLYYEDFLQGPVGFNDPNPSLGPKRQATLCAVLKYVESTLNINVNGTTNFIDLYIGQSWNSSTNPALPSVGYLAIAGPYFNPTSGYGTTPGYYAGNALLHATGGTDPQPGQYDGTILMNFDKYFNPSPNPISYWDDYLTTVATCRYDLYSVLLHEVTHALGFLSSVEEDSSFNAKCGAANNSFTKFDQLFLYYGDPCVPKLKKVVTGVSPSINPMVSSEPNELRTNLIWLRNGPVEQNHPVYSGTLDSFYPLKVGSLASHLAGSLLSFTAMSQYAPGFQPNYVMGPEIGQGQRKREWTLAEMRVLLSLGYGLNPTFSAATSLNPYGTDLNGWLLLNNSPAYRTNCSQPMLAYNSPFNFMETLTADFPSLTNNNKPSSLTTTQLMINVSELTNVADAQSDAIRVMPNTLFGIRGVSGNANNHATLEIKPSGSQIVYTPEPGFHGRAQFGFYLWDGHERGALRIVTIDVLPGDYTVPPGNQLVINPGLEDGTEMRQRLLNPNIEHSALVDWAYEGIFAGKNFSGAHPFNYLTNFWNLGGGDIMQNSWYGCFMGPNAQNGYYGLPQADWNLSGYGGFDYPTPVTTSTPNDRYHTFQGGYNYSTLINQVKGCNVYKFECDLNFEKTGYSVGQNFTFQLQFVDNPSPNYHTQLYYTVPVNVTISTVAPNTWQHVVFTFQYCGPPTYFMNLLVQGILNNPPPVVSGTGASVDGSLGNTFTPASSGSFIDNISVRQVSPTPALTLALTASPNTVGCTPTPVTLTALPVSYVPCNANYVWQPGNLSGYTVTVTPSATTTYTLTCSSTSCPQMATSSVTVYSSGSGNNISTAWPKHPTGSQREHFNAVGNLPGGDIVAAGFFSPDETFPGFPTFTSGSGQQLIVYRFSENCGTVWAVALGNFNMNETVSDLVVDAAGNIFLTGAISGNTTFGPITLSGPAAYVLKLNGNTGSVLAAYASSVSAGARGYSIARDNFGNVYMTGQYSGTIKFGSLPLLTSTGSTDVFVVRLDNMLTTPKWNAGFGSTGQDFPGGIGLSSSGLVYVAANIGGSMTVGGDTFTNAGTGTTDVFIGRFHTSLGYYVPNSGRMAGNATSSCSVQDMVVGANGVVYFTGSFTTSFITLTSATPDAYIASWQNLSLANNWIRQMGGSGGDSGRALALDGVGNLYATGQYEGTASFPGFTPSSLSGSIPTSINVYLVKMSVGNAPAYSTSSNSGSGSATFALGLTALPSGTAFLGGYFSGGTTTFGSTTLTVNALTDCYLARISSTGAFY